MYFHKTPLLLQLLYPGLLWRVKEHEKVIYLTFDDGPIPEVTQFVLEELAQFQAGATFFCVGENMVHYPDITQAIVDSGHVLANHTFNHLNGWETGKQQYLQNVEACEKAIEKISISPGKRKFRPPYGKISRAQIHLMKNHYEIVMWDVLSGDFDAGADRARALQKTIRATEPGSVVVFHDSLKAKSNLYYSLPRFLEHFSNKGYNFKTLT